MGNYDTPPSYRRNNAIRSHSRNHDFSAATPVHPNTGPSSQNAGKRITSIFAPSKPFPNKSRDTSSLLPKRRIRTQNLSFVSNRSNAGLLVPWKHTRDPTIFPDRDHEKVPDVLRQPGPAIKKSIYEKTFMYSPPAKRVPGKVKPGRPRSVPANICSGSTCKAP